MNAVTVKWSVDFSEQKFQMSWVPENISFTKGSVTKVCYPWTRMENAKGCFISRSDTMGLSGKSSLHPFALSNIFSNSASSTSLE